MKKIQCLIVEDEPLAAEVLEDFIREVPFLELVAICEDAIFALEKLQAQKIDVLFLDLHLPKLKGFDFLKTLNQSPKVIVTTAYHQYALQGYELEIVDYLLKPIEFDRFLKAVNKLKISTANPSITEKAIPEHLFFNVNKKQVKVNLAEILYVESLKEYVKIFTLEKSLVTKFQIGAIHKLLGKANFLRIHRSYLVAQSWIDAYTASTIEIKNHNLPIGRSYQKEIGKKLRNQ